MAEDTKTMTLRLDADRADAVGAIAQANDSSISDTLRGAIDKMIDDARNDAEFQGRLQDTIARNQRALDRLAK